MGCDIHSIAQVRKNGKWTTVEVSPGDDHRDYDSFAVMANVRNGTGFAGIKTGQGWPVITEPRGLPSDLKIINEQYTPGIKKGQEVWLGDHSHSWLVLSEIEDFMEKKLKGLKYQKTGVVDYETFQKIQKGEITEPNEWCGDISGPNITVISQLEALNARKGTHVRIQWFTDAMDTLFTLRKTVERLREIAKTESPEPRDVRLVFGFDS
jgi:hypothetical protein